MSQSSLEQSNNRHSGTHEQCVITNNHESERSSAVQSLLQLLIGGKFEARLQHDTVEHGTPHLSHVKHALTNASPAHQSWQLQVVNAHSHSTDQCRQLCLLCMSAFSVHASVSLRQHRLCVMQS